jgi:DNA-directed RNA polymerase subunit omega
MARVTVEDCLEKVENRFALVHCASRRARQIRIDNSAPMLKASNKEVVLSLREIAAGYVYFTNEVTDVLEEQMKRRLR